MGIFAILQSLIFNSHLFFWNVLSVLPAARRRPRVSLTHGQVTVRPSLLPFPRPAERWKVRYSYTNYKGDLVIPHDLATSHFKSSQIKSDQVKPRGQIKSDQVKSSQNV